MNPMIIDSSNLMSTASIKALETHLRHGAENDAVSMVQGSWRGLHITVKGALENGQKFSFKHIILAPYENTTRQQVMETIIPALCKEFGIDASKITIVEHSKARGGDPRACCLHWHVLVPWYDAGKNRAHDFSFDWMRQSKTAQLVAFRLGHAPLLTRHHVEIIESLRKDGEHECANWLEAAFPLNARPDNAAVPLGIVQAAAALGRDLIQTRSIVRMAERNTVTDLELKAELKKHGLFIVVGQLSPPAWVVIDQSGAVIGKLAGMAHCRVDKIIQRLGEPKHEYDTEPADERGEVAAGYREPEQLDWVAGTVAGSADRARSGPFGIDDRASAEVFVSALNAEENDLRVNAILDRALNLAAGALVKALQLWDRLETEAKAWLLSLATKQMAATPIVTSSREQMDIANGRLARAQERWGKLEGDLIFMHLQPTPPKIGLAAHQARIRKLEARRDHAARILKRVKAEVAEVAKIHQQFENHFARQQAEYRTTVIEPKMQYGQRVLAVLARCRALVMAYPESLVLGGLALFRYGCAEAEKASPNARWYVDVGEDGPDDDYTPDGGFTIH
jgi:hypothetical protein